MPKHSTNGMSPPCKGDMKGKRWLLQFYDERDRKKEGRISPLYFACQAFEKELGDTNPAACFSNVNHSIIILIIECVRTCDQESYLFIETKYSIRIKKSLTPIELIYSSNTADSLLFSPPMWRTDVI